MPPIICQGTIVGRLEVALTELELPFEVWQRLCEILLPEAYCDAGEAEPTATLPLTEDRLDAMADRLAAGQELKCDGDAEVGDHQGFRAVVQDTRNGRVMVGRHHGEDLACRVEVVEIDPTAPVGRKWAASSRGRRGKPRTGKARTGE